jgi:hypothetical protein
MNEIIAQVKQKYDVWIEEEVFENLEALRHNIAYTSPRVFICREPWSEFGVKLVEIADNNMWSAIVILKQ